MEKRLRVLMLVLVPREATIIVAVVETGLALETMIRARGRGSSHNIAGKIKQQLRRVSKNLWKRRPHNQSLHKIGNLEHNTAPRLQQL